MLAALFAVSMASLLLELSLTRLFSVVLFYHFAFLAISIALLGLGAGGVFAFLRRARLAQVGTRALGVWTCALNAIAVLVALEVVLHLPISLDLNWGNFGKLTVVYLVCAVPFFLTGLLFSVVFARETAKISLLYGADLVGGAAACMAVVPLLNVVGGPNAIVCASLLMAVAAFIWADARPHRRAAIALIVIFAALLAANYNGRLIDIVYAKGLRRDRPWMLYAKWNAISRVEVNQVGAAKYIVIDADANTALMNVDPRNWGQDVPIATDQAPPHPNLRPENAPAPVSVGSPGAPSYNWKKDLMSAAPAIVNVLRPKGDYAIIGPGGGVDVLRAVANGSPNVTGIEINPIIADDIMRGRYADYTYHLYELPQVHIHVGDGRSWIRGSHDKYDVIQMTLVDTWASTAAGAFALSENNLYTVEAFKEYFDHLKPDGIIAITRWEFKEPREALRVATEGREALSRKGLIDHDFGYHMMAFSDGALTADGRPVIVLIKKSRFTSEEIWTALHFWAETPNIQGLWMAAPLSGTEPPTGRDDGRKTVENDRQPRAARQPFLDLVSADEIYPAGSTAVAAWESSYPYNISPVTDDAPFFFFTIKTGDVLRHAWHGSGHGMDWRINVGTLVLFMLLVISLVAVLAFLILPLALGVGRAHSGGMLYFIAVGLGYILVEIAFIQRFVLFLGHPTYALTVVVFFMLLASGAGSMASRRWIADDRLTRIRFALALIVAAIVLLVFVLPKILEGLVGLAFPLKLLVSAAVLGPLGFAMGMPFPTGLRHLGQGRGEHESGIQWAWALNAAASVLGSVAAIVIAIHFGLSVTLACGAAAYLLAALLTARWPVAQA